MGFKAPFLQYEALRRCADDFIAQYHPARKIPVPIEYIVEACLGIDIVPVPGLQDGFDIVAYLTHDLKEIRIDERIYFRNLNRYRFSLAHEVAHLVLHADLFSQLMFDTVKQWRQVVTEVIPDNEYGYLEFHANSFAGLVLVPSDRLRDAFFDYVEQGQEHGIDFDEPGTGARELVEEHLARLFEVSSDVIHRRIEFDKLWHV